ncbi:MAG: ABC transporter ATP-binding protein [Chloroflexi bacterium]|nr:ABC transporter ATP-binding protein [Chloroflexota bacterium]
MVRVTKLFDHRAVVKDISFDVTPGEIFGLIGPSGSGKTTLVLMMVGVHTPTRGQVSVLGTPPTRFSTQIRERIGYMPQGFFLSPTLTPWENLSHIAGLYGMGWLGKRKVIHRLLSRLGLWDSRNKLTRDLSGGMMRRLQLAAVLIHDPELAFIDEPMAGLDPLLREEVWNILNEMKNDGKTILMTTHSMNDAERCNALTLLSQGILIARGTPGDLRRRAFGGDIVRLVPERVDAEVYDVLHRLPGVKQMNIFGGNDVRLVVENAEETLPQAIEGLRQLGITISIAERYQPPFEDVFEKLVRSD